MATKVSFPQAGFLGYLELLESSASQFAQMPLTPLLAGILLAPDGTGELTKATGHLIQLLKAHEAMLQASFDTELAADELRRYQKFAKPGQPSPHTVQLRQKQAAARQASSLSRQSFVKAAAAFVRDAGIEVPQRVALDLYMARWIDANVPKAFVYAT